MAQAYSFMANQQKNTRTSPLTQEQRSALGQDQGNDMWSGYKPSTAQPGNGYSSSNSSQSRIMENSGSGNTGYGRGGIQANSFAPQGQQANQYGAQASSFGVQGSPTGNGQDWQLPDWNQQVPTTGQNSFDQGANRTGGGGYWGDQFDTSKLFNSGTYADKNSSYARMLENSLPAAQFIQNASQYQQDYNEAQRRWNVEQGWNQSTDQFNMGLAQRQQVSAEEQARLAADQWNRQFGQTQLTDQWNRDLSQQQINNTNTYQQGIVGNQAQANSIDQAYKQGLISVEQRNSQIQALAQQETVRAARAAEALRQQEINQQMSIASMQAHGRTVAPNARWQRSWA